MVIMMDIHYPGPCMTHRNISNLSNSSLSDFFTLTVHSHLTMSKTMHSGWADEALRGILCGDLIVVFVVAMILALWEMPLPKDEHGNDVQFEPK